MSKEAGLGQNQPQKKERHRTKGETPMSESNKYHQIAAKEFSPSIYNLDGISKASVEEHLKLYKGYVNKYNEIMQKLAGVDKSTANQVYSDLRSLKVDLSFAIGGVKNHEIYFSHLGGGSKKPEGTLSEAIEKNFGSYEAYLTDLKQSGMAARGWVWTALDLDYGYLFNYLGDAQNTFPVWNAVPILALDVYEHAYFQDYGTVRANYIDAFIRNVNWDEIQKNYDIAQSRLKT